LFAHSQKSPDSGPFLRARNFRGELLALRVDEEIFDPYFDARAINAISRLMPQKG